MDQSKQTAGLVVVLFVVSVIGGWLYVDSVRNELEIKIQGQTSRAAVAPTKEQGTLMSGASRFTYDGLSFEIPSEWAIDRTGSDGDAIFTNRAGEVVAKLDCRAERAVVASEFDTLLAERMTDPDKTKAELFRHQALGDSDVPPSWTLQMDYMSTTNPCRLDARSGVVDQSVMERALQSLTMTELY